jgi:hypothetical protein
LAFWGRRQRNGQQNGAALKVPPSPARPRGFKVLPQGGGSRFVSAALARYLWPSPSPLYCRRLHCGPIRARN